jgi:hypothetical protein
MANRTQSALQSALFVAFCLNQQDLATGETSNGADVRLAFVRRMRFQRQFAVSPIAQLLFSPDPFDTDRQLIRIASGVA